MVEIRVRYEGGLRCRATHGPSDRELTSDAPVDNRGKGESFSPTDLVATALGSCMLTIMGIRAADHGWAIEGASVRVEKVMSADAPRRIARLAIEVEVPAELDAAARAELEEAALGCPVFRSIHPEIETPVRFAWGAAAPGGRARA